jgi:ABC-type multidrug transport system ATPase subunit
MRIKVENLSKRFNREWIFKNLTKDFNPGETYAIIGPNGSGKSTLLQVLWGQMQPTSGTIQFSNNEEVVLADEVFNYITIATPYMDLIDEFTLDEMIRFHFKFKKTHQNIPINTIPELLELNNSRDKLIYNFSSGMRQRLKLGLAFFSDSKILYLDEPTTNLDTKSIEWYWKHLENVMKQRMVIIASNQTHEYPQNCQIIDILNYKKGY